MFTFLLFISPFILRAMAFEWHDDGAVFWALNCDWNGNDMGNVQCADRECGGKCESTRGCTHFTWTGYQGGTCWLKSSGTSRDQAITLKERSVCGYMKGPGPAPVPGGRGTQVRTVNNCPNAIWVGAYGKQFTPENGGWKLEPGQSKTVNIPVDKMWSGRFWGRTDCDGHGRCSTGQCSGLECRGSTGKTPATLAEITFNGDGGQDFYDVSLVDGYNLPMKLRPIPGTYTGNCIEAGCNADLNANCPNELAVRVHGRVVGCKSACEAFNQDQYCCRGAFNTAATCPPTSYSRIFKEACPASYSYAYDDKTSLLTCRGANGAKGASYEVQFC